MHRTQKNGQTYVILNNVTNASKCTECTRSHNTKNSRPSCCV